MTPSTSRVVCYDGETRSNTTTIHENTSCQDRMSCRGVSRDLSSRQEVCACWHISLRPTDDVSVGAHCEYSSTLLAFHRQADKVVKQTAQIWHSWSQQTSNVALLTCWLHDCDDWASTGKACLHVESQMGLYYSAHMHSRITHSTWLNAYDRWRVIVWWRSLDTRRSKKGTYVDALMRWTTSGHTRGPPTSWVSPDTRISHHVVNETRLNDNVKISNSTTRQHATCSRRVAEAERNRIVAEVMRSSIVYIRVSLACARFIHRLEGRKDGGTDNP